MAFQLIRCFLLFLLILCLIYQETLGNKINSTALIPHHKKPCKKNPQSKSAIESNYKPEFRAGGSAANDLLPGYAEVFQDGLEDLEKIVETGSDIIKDIETGAKQAGNILVGFFKGIRKGLNTFLEILNAGKDLAVLLGVNNKEHVILVDNLDSVEMKIQCQLKTSHRYTTDSFLLQFYGFELKFKTHAPIWINGLGTIRCEFEYVKTGQKISNDIYGGNSHGKDPINLYVIRKPNPAKQQGPKVLRIDVASGRVDGRTDAFKFNP